MLVLLMLMLMPMPMMLALTRMLIMLDAFDAVAYADANDANHW